ncbi:MANSC domain-containing protein 4 [Varanus komodoensis]|nr:MANSC domain-containing protein 4 [Varanus komodoensis]
MGYTRSDCLCSPTTFYNNCWIRRFPGLTIDLEHSQRRGAHILKIYRESTAQQCSRTCCLLKNASCNLAVFYHEMNNQSLNCLHVYCPALESCILKTTIHVILYNITPGVDPDILVFEKLSFKDMNARSFFNQWKRHESARVADPEKCQAATTRSGHLSPFAVAHTLETNSSNTGTARDSIDRTAPITYLGSTAASVNVHFTQVTDIISGINGSVTTSNNASALPTAALASTKMLSHMPHLAHLNSSKHLNETKGYSGRNYSSDDEGKRPAWEGVGMGSWLLPVVFCSSLTLICIAFLATKCHQKRGCHYKPRMRHVTAQATHLINHS